MSSWLITEVNSSSMNMLVPSLNLRKFQVFRISHRKDFHSLSTHWAENNTFVLTLCLLSACFIWCSLVLLLKKMGSTWFPWFAEFTMERFKSGSRCLHLCGKPTEPSCILQQPERHVRGSYWAASHLCYIS